MTITQSPTEISYTGDGSSVDFPIPFPFDTASDLKVISSSLGVLVSGFSVAGGGGSTGTLTMTVAPLVGVTLTILDDPARTQTADYVANDAFPEEAHEKALDRSVRLIKRLYQITQRAIRTADGDPQSGTAMELGPVETRKGKYLFFNAVTGAIEYAANIVTTALSQSVIGQLLFPQSSAEATAAVVPTVYAYQADPVSDVRRYGWSAANSAAANATAIATAIAALPRVGVVPGGTVQLPAGAFNCDPFTIPQFVTVRGAGQRATQLTYAGSATFISLGATSNNGTLKYGCKICDCAIILTHKDAEGVRLRETAGGQASWMYIQGAITAGRTNRGLVIDGGNGSSFFNRIDNVICNHVENSFRLLTSGSQRSTCTMFSNCSALGDVAGVGTASKGLTIDGSQGDGSVWTGGNFEACGEAVYYANGALSTSMYGARFEGNTKDFNGVNGCFAQTIVGIQTETEYSVTDPGGMLKFDNCTLLGGAHWKRVTLGGPTGIKSRIIQGTGAFSASASVTVSIGETLPNSTFTVIAIDNSGAYTTSFAYRHNVGSNTTTTFSLSAPASTSNGFSWILFQ